MPQIKQTLSLDHVKRIMTERIDIGRTLCQLTDLPQNAAADWCRQNRAFLEASFEDAGIVEQYCGIGPYWMFHGPLSTNEPSETRDELAKHVHLLVQFLENQQENITESDRKRVFIVHGRETGVREEVARFLTSLHLKPVILSEQPNDFKALIEKFESYADVAYTVVLLTPDDAGALRGETGELAARARQNVIFEMGYFAGKLGRHRVCALITEDIERPSDINGVVCVAMDKHGAWKNELAREIYNIIDVIDLRALIGKS